MTESIEKANSYSPPQAVKNNAERGLALREKWGRGGLDASQAKSNGVGSGVARARDLKNGNVSLDTVKRMYAFFERHEKNYNPKARDTDGGPKAGEIAWLLWGGNAGRAWARSILKKEGILKSYTKEITQEELNQEGETFFNKIPVTKSLDEELMQVTFVAMQEGTDLHGDYVSSQEIQKAHNSFAKSAMKANLFHMMMTDTFSIIESYLAPVDMVLNEKFVQKGTWLVTLQVTDEDLWKMIKSGEINGVSIGALANVEPYEEEDDEEEDDD